MHFSNVAGDRASQLDVRGKCTNYTYDALGRLIAQTVPTSAQNASLVYDTQASDCQAGETFTLGRLARITDESGRAWVRGASSRCL